MKKIVLSLAGVLAAAAFAPEASAVPVFARQTGMACSACHFQHFPLLNSFGRAFKSGAFSMIGSQGKVEGEHLDIPDRLNLGVLTSTYWQAESGDKTGFDPAAPSRWGVPGAGGELSIFYGGRVSEFAGFLSELGAAGGGGAAATGAAKLALLFPVGDMRAGLVAYTGGQGAAYGFELLNTGAADTHKMMGNSGNNKQHVAAAYAGSWLGTRTDATGINLVVNSPMGFASIGKFAPAGPGTGNANDLPLTYMRAAATLDAAGWDIGAGVQLFRGDISGLGGKASAEATVIDLQAQGDLAGMETGLYVTYGSAPAKADGNLMAGGWSTLNKAGNPAGTTNPISTTNTKASSFNIAASLEFIPHTATVQAAMRMATLDNSGVAGGKSLSDNAIMLGATYELAQNVELALNHTIQSGTAWDEFKNVNFKNPEAVGKTMTTVLMEVLF